MMFDDVIIVNSRNWTGQRTNLPIYGRRVMVPTFELASNPTIRLVDVKTRRFNIIDRILK